MGMAKLDIWVRDKNCKPFRIEQPGQGEFGDYVEIYDCQGNRIQRWYLPKGIAHMEVEVPPGCYIVGGHICEPPTHLQEYINEYADRTMVIASCKQEVCVNLIVHPLKHCININLPIFTAAARRAGVLTPNLTIFAQTMMMAGNIQPQTVVDEMDNAISELRKGEGPPDRIREHEETLKTIRLVKLKK